MSISIKYAKLAAKDILSKNQDYALCGSLALYLDSDLDIDRVGDLDFVFVGNARDFDLKRLNLTPDDKYKIQEYDGYVCYKVISDKDGNYYNVFVHDDSSKIKIKTYLLSHNNPVYENSRIKIQNVEQIKEYKKQWDRPKDRLHLGLEAIQYPISSDDIPF